jgi:CBS domain-containing protein
MQKEETIDFLVSIAPFDKLSRPELESLAEDVVLEYYPKGIKILTQNGPPSEHLRLIKKGGVKVFLTSKNEGEIVIDFRSEGEQFGLVSVISGDRSRANVVAVEDTICYLIPRAKIVSLFQGNPVVNEYFMKSFFINFIDKTYDESSRRYAGFGESERRLFTTPVGNIVIKQPVTAPVSTSIRAAASVMAEHRVSSLILTDEEGLPVGILTDRDLRVKVVASGLDIHGPVSEIMSAPIISVSAQEMCFEALLKMMHHNIHHILVMEGGVFKGVVTNHDFMVLQGSAPTVLVKEVSEADDVTGLEEVVPRLFKAASTLMKEGAKPHNITGLITELSEKLSTRAVELAEQKLGPAPLQWSLFFFGEGGRRELTLSLALKAGIVYDDPPSLKLHGEAKRYFAGLGAEINSSLESCRKLASGGGPALFEGHIRSFSEWKDLFGAWRHGGREDILPELYDLRHARGPAGHVESLREHLTRTASQSEPLLRALAASTIVNRPPLGFFRRFVVEKSGEHKNEFDLFDKGVRPLVDCARLFALQRGLRESTTARRLFLLAQRHEHRYAEDMGHAVEYLLALLIHHQLDRIDRGQKPSTFMNPEKLSAIEKSTLKEIFQLTASVHEIAEKTFISERRK